MRYSRYFFLIFSPLFISILMWWIGASTAIEGEDKEFHLLALNFGSHKDSEPLWGLIAPAIGFAFPNDPFAAAVVFVYLLFIFGLWLNSFSWRIFPWIIFSPGLVYFASQALRQGIALGVFLVFLGVISRLRDKHEAVPKFKLLILPLVLTGLIHNSIAIAAVWFLFVGFANSLTDIRGIRRVQFLSVFLSIVAVGFSPVDGRHGTAWFIIACQIVLLLYSLSFSQRGRENLIISISLSVVVAGFVFTTTGLRVAIMITLLLPLVLRDVRLIFLISGLIIYPLVSGYLSGGLWKLIPTV